MTEHVCEWRWFIDYITPDAGFKCLCGAEMDLDHAQGRLNENETLKADKRLLMHVVHGRAMASSLPKHLKEGKDG